MRCARCPLALIVALALGAACNHETPGHNESWRSQAIDEELDLVFLPTSSASPDFYGGERLGRNLYATSVVALRGSTGTPVWHFQVVHHDIFDYDVPAQPILFAFGRGGIDHFPG